MITIKYNSVPKTVAKKIFLCSCILFLLCGPSWQVRTRDICAASLGRFATICPLAGNHIVPSAGLCISFPEPTSPEEESTPTRHIDYAQPTSKLEGKG